MSDKKVSGEYRIFKYYEGLCSSSNFTKEIAKVLALGVKTKSIKDADGNTIQKPFALKSKNWDIVYPLPDTQYSMINYDDLTTEEYVDKILNQVNKISDTVILKTKTTPKDISEDDYDDLTIDTASNKSSLEMYLEIYKPTYIANPEEYPLDCERNGIIPQLITKDLYEESFETTKSIEENIYLDSICTKTILPDSTIGIVEMTKDEVGVYVDKLKNIGISISMPSGNQTSSVEIDTVYLTKIRQNDGELYNFIINHLNNGEGIEPKAYSKLNKLVFEVTREEDKYTISLEGHSDITMYTIPSGSKYIVKNIPTVDLMPEYRLDGVYTPLDTELYHVDNQTIFFDDNIQFDSNKDGLLVVRYTYESQTDNVISDRKTLLNNHYVLMRLFDNINDEKNGPAENVYNQSGEITQTKSHISPWSKLSWYQDFEEIMVDTIDKDINTTSMKDGVVLVPLETPGLNADTQMRYWINTNNDRFSLIVMGNPSLDYERDRHLISACYCGRIDSFENSINDTAGNFALFTSSSTEPCNTKLSIERIDNEMPNYLLTQEEIDNNSYDKQTWEEFKSTCWSHSYTGNSDYYIQLTDKTYFNKEKWAKYVIVDINGNPLTPLVPVFKRYFNGTNNKADSMQITINQEHVNSSKFNDSCRILISYASYQEKNVIVSGIARDVFGNVIDVDKIKDYGINTSDGVTSIMMYHTRSKAYYQKHHMLFATTEEYMSKVIYGKSSYTGEYYADRIKVTHGNDGPRGTLSDLLVIDTSSLYAMDELVINKDFEKDKDAYEETFVFFPVTAPFSPLSDSPNSRYGLAIKKQEIEPKYTDEDIILQKALGELDTIKASWDPTDKNIYPQYETDNNCLVYWKVLNDTAWLADKSGNRNPTQYVPLKLAVQQDSSVQGDLDNLLLPVPDVTLAQSEVNKKGNSTISSVKVSGFNALENENIAYGISDVPIEQLGSGANVLVVMNDGTEDKDNLFEYNVDGVPFSNILDKSVISLSNTELDLVSASPEKYLVLYSVLDDRDNNNGVKVSKFACLPLKHEGENKNDLLQYQCSINVYISGGKGSVIYNNNKLSGFTTILDYNSTLSLKLEPADKYKLGNVKVFKDDEDVNNPDKEPEAITDNQLVIDKLVNDIRVEVQFVLK